MDLLDIKRAVLDVVKPILKGLGGILPVDNLGTITAQQSFEARRCIRPGTVILTLRYYEFGNWLIPGYWSHAAIALDSDWVVEAVGRGVVQTRMGDFLRSKDEILVVEPRFATNSQMARAAYEAKRLVGMPYDWDFEPNDSDFYCFEVCWHAYDKAVPRSPFRRSIYFGEKTVLGDDFLVETNWRRLYSVSRDKV